jgi:hypothetical protein
LFQGIQFKQVGDRLGEANTYVSLGAIESSQGRIADMRQDYEQALALYQAIDDLFSVGRALVYYGDALFAAGEGGVVRKTQHLTSFPFRDTLCPQELM